MAAGKAVMEGMVREQSSDALIIRTAAFFSPFDAHNYARAVEASLCAGREFQAVADEVVTPTYVPDLVNATLDLALDGTDGIWHLTNEKAVTWEIFARWIARALSLPERLIMPCRGIRRPALRPAFSALTSARGHLLPQSGERDSTLCRRTRAAQSDENERVAKDTGFVACGVVRALAPSCRFWLGSGRSSSCRP